MPSQSDQTLAADFNAISPTPATLSDAVAPLTALTVSVKRDTNFANVQGVLYGRGSWDRVQEVSTGTAGTLTVPSGSTGAQVEAICQMLIDEARPPGADCAMSESGVYSRVTANLTLLEDTKLPDGKGVLWAAAEYASGDPGDSATLLGTLVNLTVPKYDPAPTPADLQRLQSQGLISQTIPVT